MKTTPLPLPPPDSLVGDDDKEPQPLRTRSPGWATDKTDLTAGLQRKMDAYKGSACKEFQKLPCPGSARELPACLPPHFPTGGGAAGRRAHRAGGSWESSMRWRIRVRLAEQGHQGRRTHTCMRRLREWAHGEGMGRVQQ